MNNNIYIPINEVISGFQAVLSFSKRGSWFPSGICTALAYISRKDLLPLFKEGKGYYSRLLMEFIGPDSLSEGFFLFEPYDWESRTQFLKDEIQDLRRLKSEGYTHLTT